MKKKEKIGKKWFILDRGRYKSPENVGSVSTKKRLMSTGDRGMGGAIGRRAQMIAEIDAEIAKGYK